MKKGLLVILSGPSGVGKGTVRKYIMSNFKLDLSYSISMTTRAKRDKEVDGVDYYFVSKEEFQRNIDEDNFLEWEEFVGNRYGTPKDKVEELRNQGKHILVYDERLVAVGHYSVWSAFYDFSALNGDDIALVV